MPGNPQKLFKLEAPISIELCEASYYISGFEEFAVSVGGVNIM